MRTTATIHSFLNLIVKPDYKTGETKITRKKDWHPHERKIIFVDECSMIDHKLYQAIQDATLDCKVVYVGDHHQLSPVGELLSKVYQQGSLMKELTTPVRNAGQPALMALCQQFRNTVATGEFHPIEEVRGVIDYLDDDGMAAQLEEHFSMQNTEARVLAFSNKRVNAVNSYIRKLRGLPDQFVAGENLINSSPAHVMKLGKRVALPAEHAVRVIRNQGAERVLIAPDRYLDVDLLDIDAGIAGYFNSVPVPTNRSQWEGMIKEYKAEKDWQRAFLLQENFLDLRQIEAATVHKSQGSTYETVFVDLGNIGTCNISDMVARMLYVSLSRARNRIFLYGELPDKYGG